MAPPRGPGRGGIRGNVILSRVQRNSVLQHALWPNCSQDVLAQKSFSLAQKNSRKYDELNKFPPKKITQNFHLPVRKVKDKVH